MSILNCLRGDPALLHDLRDVMIATITGMAAEGSIMFGKSTPIDFMTVYKRMIAKDGLDLEMDIETASVIYEDIKGELKTGVHKDILASMTSAEDLQELVGGEIKKLIEELGVKKHRHETVKNQLNINGKTVAKALFGVMNNHLFAATKSLSSSVKVREIVAKYAKEVLGKNLTGRVKVMDALAQALDNESLRDFAGEGTESLWKSLWPEIQKMGLNIKDDALRARFMNEMQKIRDASFKMGMTKGTRKQILYDTIKKTYGKEINTAGGKKVVVDWPRMAKAGDLNKILDDLLGKELDRLKYTGDKSKIYEALIDEYKDLRASASYNKAFEVTKNNRAALIKEVAISKGFTKRGDGERLLDYAADNPGGREWLRSELIKIGETVKAGRIVDGPLTAAQAQDLGNSLEYLVGQYEKTKSFGEVREAVNRLMAKNNVPYKEKVSKLDRLAKLLDTGVGLDSTTDAIASNILGLKLDTAYIAKLKDILEQQQKLMVDAEELYSDAGIDPAIAANLPKGFKPSLFSTFAQEDINRKISDLLSESIRNGDWLSAQGAIESIDKAMRMSLSAKLINASNLSQNTVVAIINMAKTFQGSGRSLKQVKKEFMQEFTAIMSGREIGYGTSTAVRTSSDVTTLAHTKDSALGPKVWAALKLYTEGILTAIDTAAYVVTTRNNMHKSFREALIIKKEAGDNSIDVNKILAAYPTESEEAVQIARRNLEVVGITPANRKPRDYASLLAREAASMEFIKFMGGPLSEYVKPERVLTLREAAINDANNRLGKQDAFVMKKKGDSRVKESRMFLYGNPMAYFAGAIRDKRNEALKDYIENPTKVGQAQLLLAQLANMGLLAGPMAYASGSYRWGDIALQGAGAGFTQMPRLYKYKKRYKDLITGKSIGTFNEDDVKEAKIEYDTARWRVGLAMTGLMATAGILAIVAAMSDGDDGDDWWERVLGELADLADDPGLKIFLTRISPPIVRYMTELGIRKRKGQDGYKMYKGALGSVVNTRSPTNISDIIDAFVNPFTGEMDWPGFMRMMGGAFFGIGDIFSAPLNLTNFVGDEIRGKITTNKYDYSSSPIVRPFTDNPYINGLFWGMGGTALNYAIDNRNVGLKDFHVKETGKTVKQQFDTFYGRSFESVNWAENGHVSWNTKDKKKGVAEARTKLDQVYKGLFEVSNDLGGPFRKKSVLDIFWDDPKSDDFLIDATHIKDKLKAISPKLEKEITPTGKINLLKVVLAKYKMKNIQIDNLIIARKYELYQEQLSQNKK